MSAGREIYRGRVVDLWVEEVTLPNGKKAELEIVRHSGAAAVVPLLPDGHVVLIHQFRYAASGFLYEIPAGRLHPGEPPESCADRELGEEAGYRAARYDRLASILTTPGFSDEVIHIFLGTGLTRVPRNLDPDEVLRVVELPLEEAIAMIGRGEIRDAKTIAGLHLVYLRIRRAEGEQ